MKGRKARKHRHTLSAKSDADFVDALREFLDLDPLTQRVEDPVGAMRACPSDDPHEILWGGRWIRPYRAPY